jgi:hypothetical protein
MTAYTWNSANGGDWNTTTDWTPNGTPGAADSALFSLGGDQYTVTGDASAASITVDADDVSFTGTLTLGAGQSGPGLIGTDGAYIDIAPTAFVTDTTLSFDAGSTLEVDGLLASSGGTLDTGFVTGPTSDWIDTGTLTANALYVNTEATFAGNVVLLNDGGSISLDTSAVFSASNIVLLGSALLYVANAAGDTTGSLGLAGQTIEVGAGGVLSLGSDPGVTVTVSGGIGGNGSVDVSAGNYVFAAPDSYSAFTQVDTGGTLTLQGTGAAGSGPIFLNDGALITQTDSTGGAGSETVVGSGGDDTVTATAGALLIFGGTATSLTFQGGTGASTVVGGTGVVNATGGTAGDIIFAGTSGVDSLTAGTGPTTLAGAGSTMAGAGATFTATGAAADVLVAGGGNVTLNGAASSGNNIYFTGGTGNTVVEGGSGLSTILAFGTADTISGAAGTQNIFLGSGTNTLDFTSGLTTGLDKVVGFTSGDMINLVGFSPTEVQTVLSSAQVTGGSTFLTLSDNTHIALFGFTGLTASNFG